jgi:hypothetical protein
MHLKDYFGFQVFRKSRKGCSCGWAQKNPASSGEFSPEEPGRILSQYINPSALGVKAHLGVMMIVMVLKCISVVGHDSPLPDAKNTSSPLFVCQVLFFTNYQKNVPLTL